MEMRVAGYTPIQVFRADLPSASLLNPTPRRKLAAFFLLAGILTVVLFCSALHAQDDCPVEVKLLLSPGKTQPAVTALGAGAESSGQVYLFDSDKLDLLSQGVIVRLRQGTSNDLMVKLRPRSGKQFANPSTGDGKYKCEVDVAGGEGQPSYSVTTPYTGNQPPTTGIAVFALLTTAQKALLQEAEVSIDWSRVHRVAEIQSTTWLIPTLGSFRKLTLEQWKWPGAQVLELSAKAKAKQGAAAYSDLQQLAKTQGLSLSEVQRLKTSLVLQSVTSK
jgi:hypothetical protein